MRQLIGAMGVLLLAFLLWLRFAPPQSARWPYLFQAHVSPAYPDGVIPLPSNHTGMWRVWRRNGTMTYMGTYHHGSPHGTHRMWDNAGRLMREVLFTNGEPMRVLVMDGHEAPKVESWLREEKLHGICLQRNADGRVIEATEYEDGEPRETVTIEKGETTNTYESLFEE